MKNLIILITSLFCFTLSAQTAKKDYVGIDVRSMVERKWNPAPGAIALSNAELSGEIKSKVPNTNTKIKVFCEAGVRAAKAKEILESLGYKNVENIRSWREWNQLKK